MDTTRTFLSGENPVMASSGNQRSLALRLLWFAGLWLAGVTTVAAVAYGIRLFIT
jgi:hypothetical protein